MLRFIFAEGWVGEWGILGKPSAGFFLVGIQILEGGVITLLFKLSAARGACVLVFSCACVIVLACFH